jgi:hypothetical protein
VVGSLHDKSRSGLSMNSKVQFVLHGDEKGSGDFRIGAVIHGRGEDVDDFLVELSLIGADLSNFRQESIKIFLAEKCAVFEAFLVPHIPTVAKITRPTDGTGLPVPN